jgi:hypothetical protein
MTLRHEILMALIDGELSPEETSRVEAELRTRPDLAAYVEQQRELRHRLHVSFAEMMNAPVPQALRDAVGGTQPSLAWRIARAFRAIPRGIIWTGVPAAALACGVAVGVILSGNFSNTLMDGRGGSLMARGSLAHALDNQLAAAGPAQGPQIGISFRDRNNRYCRTFTTPTLGGVACHEAAGWNIAAISQRAPEPSGVYGTAATGMPDVVRQAVRGMIEGAPLDAAGETRARDNGWKVP